MSRNEGSSFSGTEYIQEVRKWEVGLVECDTRSIEHGGGWSLRFSLPIMSKRTVVIYNTEEASVAQRYPLVSNYIAE
jgi:hypothetical protein